MYQIIKKWEGGETPAAADGAETGKTDMRKFNWIGMQRRRSGGWSQKYDLLLFFSILPYVTHPVSLFLLLCPSCQATVTLNQSNSHTVVKLSRWALRGRHYVLVACYLLDFSGFLIELLDQKVNLLLEKWIWFYTVIFVLFAMSLYFCLAGSKWRNKSFTRELLEASSAIQKGCFTCRG